MLLRFFSLRKIVMLMHLTKMAHIQLRLNIDKKTMFFNLIIINKLRYEFHTHFIPHLQTIPLIPFFYIFIEDKVLVTKIYMHKHQWQDYFFSMKLAS